MRSHFHFPEKEAISCLTVDRALPWQAVASAQEASTTLQKQRDELASSHIVPFARGAKILTARQRVLSKSNFIAYFEPIG